MYFDRFDICEAYAMYDILWGPTAYGARLRRIGFSGPCLLRLEDLSENGKAIYGALVRRNNRMYVAFGRYQKRNASAPSWPGTNNMPNGARSWLKEIGALAAVEVMA